MRAVRQLAEHYHKSPELITEEELRQYFLYIKNVKHYSRSTATIAICGIKFFFERTLEKDWTTFNLVRPAPEKKLPVILSLAEVRQILARIRLPRYQVCLTTIYSCGLRLQEGTHLQVADIDSARMMIHVRHGKGAKDRYVPLPERTLQLLRLYWKQHHNPVLLFPAEGRNHIDLARATEPLSKSSVQDAFRAALKESGNNKRASVHTLRHFLGHASAGSRRQPAPHPGVVGSQFAGHHQRLHAPDRESRTTRGRGHQSAHERPLNWRY